MEDFGWVENEVEGTWELLGSRGEPVWWVTAEFVDRVGVAAVNAKAARIDLGWPDLVPGKPCIQCVLTDGPLAGTFVFLNRDEYDAPPPDLEVTLEQPLPGMPDGPGPDLAVRVRPATYRLAVQGCGHGNGCPWPYEFDPDAVWAPASALAGAAS